ncbi:MAG: BadF/BadG/BcrA/BcrD ATPase family protein [Woeseiaceae bacterium]
MLPAGCRRANVVARDGSVLGSGSAGPANPLREPDRTIRAILAATDQALEDASLAGLARDRLIAGIGLAGVNVPAAFKAMSDWGHPFRELFLTTDMHIACYGAHGAGDGAVIISGTGCSGYAIVDGVHRTFSGFGFPFGDSGGSDWIGLEALRHVFLAIDGLGPSTELVGALNAHFGAEGIGIVEKLANAQPCDFGRLAPIVFDAANQGDEIANAIVENAANHIAALARRILQLKPSRLSLVGGLGTTILPRLDHDVRENLSPALNTASDGAIIFAREQLSAAVA